MIDIALKLLFILVSAIILVQDVKERQVYWFLYPLAGAIAAYLQIRYCGILLAFVNVIINLIIVLLILTVNWGYVTFIMKRKFINEVIGLGDIIFFICLTATFATAAFIVIFVFSLLFSLILYNVMRRKLSHDSVPLAGYMALFFSGIYSISLVTDAHILYLM